MGGSSMVACTVPMTALGGGLIALQAMAVSTGLPSTLVLLAACYAIIRGLLNEPR
nr:BCCT family transporter [Rhodovulum tesquicola]